MQKNERTKNALEKWHEFIETRNPEILDEILSENVKFHSPFVWKPKEGKSAATAILLTASEVFEDFGYVREILGATDCMLEFEAKIDSLNLRGVDIIKFDADGKFVDFEVMIRPANALEALGRKMTRRLTARGFL